MVPPSGSRRKHDASSFRRFAITCSVALAMVMLVVPSFAAALGMYPKGSTGVDVSWPNCTATPPASSAFGVVGVTGGLDFKANPCVYKETTWFSNPILYMNTGYPGAKVARRLVPSARRCSLRDDPCAAYQYGFRAAVYAITYAASQNVHASSWWLDVETENSWTNDTGNNRTALQGMIDATKSYSIAPRVGFYSTPRQWRIITGDWKNDLPNWVGTGSTKRSVAISACKKNNFTSGGTQLVQYTFKLDQDYVCR